MRATFVGSWVPRRCGIATFTSESLADERGLLVGFDRPDEIADAVIRLLRDHGLRRRIEARAYAYGRQTTWPAVGRRVVGEMHRLERLRGEPALTGDTVRV